MNESKISVRYAKALFQAAVEGKLIREVMSDMDILMKAYSLETLSNVLDSPIVKTSDKKKVIELLFSGKLTELSMNFINLVLSNKRERYLPDISSYFEFLYKKNEGILSAEIVVPKKIDPLKKDKFRDLLKKTYNSEILLEEVIKPEIIGGFILRVEDEQFDASVVSELAKVKKQLLESSSVKY